MPDPTPTVEEVRAAKFARLLEPFQPEQISKLPRGTCRACSDSSRKRCDNHSWVNNCGECGGRHSSATIHLDYVGHADVTKRLLEVDPEWNWEPVATDPNGLPIGGSDGMWIKLTVLGVTRLGFGDAAGKRGPNATKELIGDALRNAALRFGVAVDLWSKADSAVSKKEADHGDGETRSPLAEPDAPPAAPPFDGQFIADAATGIAQKFPGDRSKLLPMWQDTDRHGALGLMVKATVDGEDVEIALGDYIKALGDTPVPERQVDPVDPGPAQCEATTTHAATGAVTGRCRLNEHHDGDHDYTASPV